jgi:5-methylcytosine-specific restriction endonuclease McrBC GTP-binding regulatory subunit McrB
MDFTNELKKWFLNISPRGYYDWVNESNIDRRFKDVRENYYQSFNVENVFEADENQLLEYINEVQNNCAKKGKVENQAFADYSNNSGSDIPNAILNTHFTCFLDNYKKVFRFISADDLRKKVNVALGTKWCDDFQYLRKELAGLEKAGTRGQLFKSNEKDGWFINEGGGTEIQYHLAFDSDDIIYYGLGFNTQYVPFSKKSMIEYMRPYMQAYLNREEICQKSMYGCSYQHGNEKLMRNPQNGNYCLIGKSIEVWDDKDDEDDTDFEYIMNLLDFEMLIQNLKEWKKVYKIIFEERNRILAMENNITIMKDEITKYANQLLQSKNIILTGAPGTGKTFLAKKIAKEIAKGNDDHIEFVQFHPSYDYTDFAEGLRPVKEQNQKEIGFVLKDGIFKAFCSKALKTFKEDPENQRNFVFIIDEINRGEMSKIFGELFFSIDPGYRGEKGRIKTQYSNLTEKDDIFYAGFYVPENVYIIGTMNDIDRSVESFDFAMHRRFTWIEIKASDTQQNILNSLQKTELADRAKSEMNAINDFIYSDYHQIEGLNSSYHIGAAYFLKLDNFPNEENPFECLWSYHIEPLLKEYLRGIPDNSKILTELKQKYNDAE